MSSGGEFGQMAEDGLINTCILKALPVEKMLKAGRSQSIGQERR
jgi:hypothetical protein